MQPSPSSTVAVFAGQGSNAIFTSKARAVAARDSKTTVGKVLVDACQRAFTEELSSIPEDRRQGLDIADFTTILEPAEKYQSHALIQGITLCLFQLLRYIPFLECSLLEVAGFCSGMLPASVVAASAGEVEFLVHAVQAFRLAFWIGYRCQEYKLQSGEKETGNEEQSWGLVVFGWTRENGLDAIREFNNKGLGPKLHLTAVSAERCITVSGRSDILSIFQSYIPSTCSIRPTNVYTLYHGSDELSAVKASVLSDIADRNIRFPTTLKTPLRSTVSGDHITDGKNLVEEVLDMVLIQCVNWDLASAEILKAAIEFSASNPSKKIELLNFGPGSLLPKAPLGDVKVLDVSHTSDVAAASYEDGIAIVGMGVNFPGAPNVSEFWKVLEDGLNTVSEIPQSRFDVSEYYDPSPNKSKRSMGTKYGNFLTSPAAFDSVFFNISPREAKSMDPQQRVLLQTAYTAIENAGYVPDSTESFKRETFGCYVGVATGDYIDNLRNDIDVYYSTGTLRAFLSGRISYALKLSGPSIVLDTACSGSMIAIYQACRALERGDCNAAVAGGVNVISGPDMYLGLDRAHFLSPTGQCKAFDESADGYCRSEGCGMFVLKRVSDALAEGDRILGVIRGVQVNQSGEAHSITHPHAATQEILFAKLLKETGVDPLSISVIEAHGTGTQAGDPIELESLRAAFAKNRTSASPLHITSVKANIGHCEAASGAAGLAKLLLMLKHQKIPKQISLKNLNPRIAPLEVDGVTIARSNLPWTGRNRIAMLNNFGAAGSNGAMLLQEAPSFTATPLARERYVFGMSAKSKNALESLRQDYISHFSSESEFSLADIAYTATARRQVFSHRIAVTASSIDELVSELQKAVPTSGPAPRESVVFVFSGQGSQYLGMGRQLLETSPLFKSIVQECHDELVKLGFAGVLPIVAAVDGEELTLSEKEKVESFQASIFVLEYALAQLWISWGFKPDAVLGHSLGEYAALAIAGVLTLKDALKLVAHRARFMAEQCKPSASGMLAVNLSPEKMDILLEESYPSLSVACRNSPNDCVVAGAVEELDVLKPYLKENGVKSSRLTVPYGYHSAAMDPILESLTELAETVTLSAPKILVGSNVFGKVLREGDMDATYFAKHARQPVRFVELMSDLAAGLSDAPRFIEIGPHPITLPMLRASIGSKAEYIPSMNKSKDPWNVLSSSLADLYRSGVPAKWRGVFDGTAAKVVELPSYPFATPEYWVPYVSEAPAGSQVEEPVTAPKIGYAMISKCVQMPSQDASGIFEVPISQLAKFITGHMVGGSALCPASVYHELALESARVAMPEEAGYLHTLANVAYSHPLVYEDQSMKTVRITLNTDGSDATFEVSSYTDASEASTLHCSGEIRLRSKLPMENKFYQKAPLLERRKIAIFSTSSGHGPETIHTRLMYETIFPRVVRYSKPYQTVRSITIDPSGNEGFAVVKMPDNYKEDKFVAHPVFMDTLLHVAGFIANSSVGSEEACICNGTDSVKMLTDEINYDDVFGIYCSNVYMAKQSMFIADAYAVDSSGKVVAMFKGMHFKKLKLSGFKALMAMTTGKKTAATTQSVTKGLRPVMNQRPPTPVSRAPSPMAMNVDVEVHKVIADTCGVELESVTSATELESVGVDSLMIFEIADRLKSTFPGTKVDTAILGACHTVRDLELAIQVSAPVVTSSFVEVSPPKDIVVQVPFPHTPPLSSDEVPVLDVRAFLQEILGVDANEIQKDTELESLGLDSLTSIEVLHSLKQSLDLEINPESFQSCHTVAELELLISGAMQKSIPVTQALVPTHSLSSSSGPTADSKDLAKMLNMEQLPVPLHRVEGNGKSPLFLIHDGSGLCNYYSKLTSLERAVFGIYNPRFFDEQQWAGGLVEQAAAYAAYVSRTSNGPCILGGWSYGGVVAFEAARQLLAQNRPVAGILLIDSPPPLNHQPLSAEIIAAVSKSPSSSSSSGPRARIEGLIKRQFETNTANLAAYRPKIGGGSSGVKVALLRSREGFSTVGLGCERNRWLEDRADVSAVVEVWDKVLGASVKVVDIPGDHFGVFENGNVKEVSQRVREACRFLEES
ncbi:Type I Iterative PKS [Rhizina undulata]